MPRSDSSNDQHRKVSRPPLERMQRIHQMLLKNTYPNCTSLAELLEVSTKTVQRDINFMRDRQSLPIEFDPVRNGYFYTEAVKSLPAVQVTEGEVVALYVAQKALDHYRGTRFHKPLEAAFKKLTAGLQDSISFPLDGLDDAISFRITGTAEADLEVFERLHEAVAASTEVLFRYRSLNDRRPRTRWIEPYHLLGAINAWYLIGFDRDREAFRVFALQRISDVEVTSRKFSRITDFNPQHFLRGTLGVFIGQEPQKVRIHFDAFAAQLVRERHWHESQEIKELPDDELEITLELNSLFEVERWVLSWGAHARVIEPVELREQILAKARGIIAVYESDDELTADASLFQWEVEAHGEELTATNDGRNGPDL